MPSSPDLHARAHAQQTRNGRQFKGNSILQNRRAAIALVPAHLRDVEEHCLELCPAEAADVLLLPLARPHAEPHRERGKRSAAGEPMSASSSWGNSRRASRAGAGGAANYYKTEK